MYRLNEKIRELKPYDPIRGSYRVRLDANESFRPMPASIRKKLADAAASVTFNRYPDPLASELCESFARYYGVDPAFVTAGNGSDELISVLTGAFLMKGDAVMTLVPDFTMYRFYTGIDENRCFEFNKKPDFTIDVDEVIGAVKRYNIKMLIFSNPCNPTGVGLKREEVRRLVRSVDALVVLDEAYMDFWDQTMLREAGEYDNLVILRTCSKVFGMAGVRLGFAVANTVITNALKAVKSPYNVNAFTQKAGAVIYGEKEWAESSVREIVASKDALYSELKRLAEDFPEKLSVSESVTNFVLIRTREAERLYGALLEQGVAVRLLNGFLRVTAGSAEENAEFMRALRSAL